MRFSPVPRVIEQLLEHETPWSEVVSDLENAGVMAPVYGDPERRQVLGDRFMAYVVPSPTEGQWLVIGVRPRKRASLGLSEPVVGIPSPEPRSSRRGGSGTRWPTTYAELLNRLTSQGYRLDGRGKHLSVLRGQSTVATLPKTASDWRSLVNCCTTLRRQGIDVRR